MSNGRNVPALALLVVVKLLLDHADDNFVADETTLVHDLLSFATKSSLLGDLGAKHVTGGLLQEKERWLATRVSTGNERTRMTTGTHQVAA